MSGFILFDVEKPNPYNNRRRSCRAVMALSAALFAAFFSVSAAACERPAVQASGRTDAQISERPVSQVSERAVRQVSERSAAQASESAYVRDSKSALTRYLAAAADKGKDSAQAKGKESAPKSPEGEKPAEYIKNRWNFVETSMDISGGIPEDVQGRLALIRDAGKLRVATEPYYAPQEFIDPSLEGQEQYQGADMDLARLIAERMGVELEIVPLEFTQVLSGTADGTYDLAISGLAYTPARANSMELTKGYHYSTDDSRTGFLIRKKDSAKIREEQDLAGRDIAAQAGSLQELLALENVTQYRQFIRFSSMDQVYKALETGIVDAAAADIETARLYIENNPSCGLMILEGIYYQLEDELKGDRIAAPGGEIELAAFVNGVIDEILGSGQYEKWFKEYHDYAARLGL